MSATIAAAELGRIIDDAALFAGRDKTLPMLNAIRLESTPKNLIAIATDRFTLGASVADYSEDGGGAEFSVYLKLPQAQMVSKLAKSCKEAFSEVAITIAGDKVTFAFTSGEALTVPKVTFDQEPPDWRKIIGNTANADAATAVIGVNPAYLSRFGRVHDARRMTMKTTGPSKPILLSVGDSFIGVIMPVRLSADSPELLPAWVSKPEPVKPEPVNPRARKPRKATARREAVPA